MNEDVKAWQAQYELERWREEQDEAFDTFWDFARPFVYLGLTAFIVFGALGVWLWL